MSLLLGILGISTTTLLVIAAIVIGFSLFTWIAWAEFVKNHWKLIVIIGSIIILSGGGYITGYYRADQKCETATLLLKIKQLERDIKVQKEADKIEEAELEKLKVSAEEDAQEIADYEKKINEMNEEKRKTGGEDCDTLTQEEIDKLIYHGRKRNAPGGPR